MNYVDYEKFAKKHGIETTEVEGTMGCGYACAYVYFEPKSVMRVIEKLENKLGRPIKPVENK